MVTQEDFNDDLDTPTEADLDTCYGSKYLGAVDIGDKKIRTRIGKIRKETMPERDGKAKRPKLVLYFTTLEKPMVLNATNKETLVEAFGKNPANWINTEVGILAVNTQFAGKPVKGLRLKVLSDPKAASKMAPSPKPMPKLTPKPAAAEESWPPDQPDDPGPEFIDAAE